MLRNYFKTAYRNLLKNKVHSAINIAGLSIGIACAIVISVFVRYESTFDQYHKQTPNTFRVVQHTQHPEGMEYWGATCYPLAEALRNDFGDFAHVTQCAGPMKRFFSVDRGNSEIILFEEPHVLYIDTAYARVFDFAWLAGNPREALTEKNSVVLTETTAEKSFGAIQNKDYASVLGKTVMLNGKDPLIITGVVKDAPGNTTLQYAILVPYEFFKENNNYQATNWAGNYGGSTFVVLKNNSNQQAIEQKIAGWKKKYMKPEDDARINYFFQPVSEMHNETIYGTARMSYIMPHKILNAATLVGIFILVIAAVNFINLTTARAITRSKEVGVRKVMGSTRIGLMMQFVYEHSLLIVVTLSVSVGLGQLAIDQLNNFLTTINLKLTFSLDDAGAVLLIGCVVILLAAVYPAVVLSSFSPVDAIRNKMGYPGRGGFSLRRLLIVFQFTIVQLLIIATIVVATQIRHFSSADLGFVTQSVVSIPVPDGDKIEAFRNKLLENKNFTEVSFASNAPIQVDGNYGTSYRLPQQDVVEGKMGQMTCIYPNYIDFFGIKLIAGRNITELRDPFDEFLVNEKLVRSMGWTPEEALGRRLTINEGEGTIVGVVEDYQNRSLKKELASTVLLNWKAIQARTYVKFTHQTPETLSSIEKVWKEFAPQAVFSHVFVAEAIDRQYALEHLVFNGFTVFSGLAILIGCLGLFGLASFMAIRRAKEIGIRKVLGASLSHVLSQFSREFILMVIFGFVLAAPVAYMMMERWLSEFPYRIDISWWMFASGGAIALLVALATVSFHSLRVGMANPVDSLRNE
ncbi:MAG TPA: ABC transporter permease [Cyclobacteriaceae bacterium]|nr:ABC transporter permease [Cyclobacteriaceae bacterium]